MKIKADKKAKPADVKLHKLKKSKNDIGKPKEKKSSSGPLVAAAVTPHTFAEKKVLAVKKKNQKKHLVESVKTAKVSQKKKDSKASKPKGVAKKAAGIEQKDASSEKTKRKRKWKKKPKNAEREVRKEKETTETETETLVSKKIITAAVKACKKAIEAGFDKKKNLFGEDLKYGLQIAAVKIPDVPSRNCRLQLPNPIYEKGDDICLIVKDLERNRKLDHEDTLTFWKEKLSDLGIDYITQVIPFRQLKQDYKEYEMKIKLVHRFNRFLVDTRINGHVFNFLGNNFIRRCKNPTPVILDKDEKIVKSIERALGRLTYKQTNTGRLTEIQFATHKMSLDKAVENAESLLQTLKTQYPGGWQNIRTIYLKPMTDIQLTFPLYVSKLDPNLVPVPKITGPRERFEKSMNEKLLDATQCKYKFQGGNLVRVAFEQRKPKSAKGKAAPVEKDEEEKDAAAAAAKVTEPEVSSDEEMELDLGKASDTEESDLGDSD